VDGLIAVAGGAGGHAGTQSLISLVREMRELWPGCLVAAGAIADGFAVRAVEVLGADLAYVGTRFIATRESRAQDAYKAMLVESRAGDLVYTDRVSGVHGNFLLPSLVAAGVDPAAAAPGGPGPSLGLAGEAKAWKTVWSAGHGVSTVHDVPGVAELVARMAAEYDAACRLEPSAALR
jgi:nitronate monooxygenase